MIPYLDLSAWPVPPFPLLVAAGVAVGHWLFIRRARAAALHRTVAGDVSLCLVAGGFAGAILGKSLYFPAETAWRFHGLSSFGGLAGGLLASVLYFVLRRLNPWPYLDAAAFAFPSAWALGRLGCALAHDHPGVRSDRWFAVAYPGGARFDLGLLEFLFTVAIVILFRWLDRSRRETGFYLAVLLLLYGPFRVSLDLLHVDPPAYWGWPVDRLCGLAVLVLGILALYNLRVRRCE